jgi:hypothetical protein
MAAASKVTQLQCPTRNMYLLVFWCFKVQICPACLPVMGEWAWDIPADSTECLSLFLHVVRCIKARVAVQCSVLPGSKNKDLLYDVSKQPAWLVHVSRAFHRGHLTCRPSHQQADFLLLLKADCYCCAHP